MLSQTVVGPRHARNEPPRDFRANSWKSFPNGPKHQDLCKFSGYLHDESLNMTHIDVDFTLNSNQLYFCNYCMEEFDQ